MLLLVPKPYSIILDEFIIGHDVCQEDAMFFTNNKKYCNKQLTYLQYFFMISIVWLFFLNLIIYNT
ncbi:hypothetical protein CN923_00295 [Bacillus cereus]|nr:hypothetical protein CON44_14580 [Bacillus cereus]PEQ41471.1 hypothetical protein CN467_07850 [Bacillus cereus]PEX93086.1 hypothetical protein CN465_21565 [Bacillus cereus]PFK23312.1 hypothetical protein COJ05_14920 [Bacillus cereus]PFP60824.1 hypothetical protein COK09_10680 [Bacillus cereus]